MSRFKAYVLNVESRCDAQAMSLIADLRLYPRYREVILELAKTGGQLSYRDVADAVIRTGANKRSPPKRLQTAEQQVARTRTRNEKSSVVLFPGGTRRRHRRFKDSIRGSIEYRGAAYHCLVQDISQAGLHLLSRAAVDRGDRMTVKLRMLEDVGFSCVVTVRHVTNDGLGAEITYISKAHAETLTRRIEEHRSALRGD